MPVDKEPRIGFICPLYTEIKAILATFDRTLPQKTIRGTRYYYGMIRDREVVAVQFPYNQTGPITAAHCANKLIQDHPTLNEEGSYCFLVGIAGGIWTSEYDVRLGDVVIATKTWDWRTGKTTSRGFVSTEDPKRAPNYLLDGLGEFLYQRSRLGKMIDDQIANMQTKSSNGRDEGWDFPGQRQDILYNVGYKHATGSTCEDCDRDQIQRRRPRTDVLPRVHDGLVASGNTVLKDAINRETLEHRPALAVEMEACGVPETFVCVRGISDYADSHKNDIWQPYAAATAAACTRLLIDSLDGVASTERDLDQLAQRWVKLDNISKTTSLFQPRRRDRIDEQKPPQPSKLTIQQFSENDRDDGFLDGDRDCRQSEVLMKMLGELPSLYKKFLSFGIDQYADCASFCRNNPDIWKEDPLKLHPVAMELWRMRKYNLALRAGQRHLMLRLKVLSGNPDTYLASLQHPTKRAEFEEVVRSYIEGFQARLE